MTTQTYQRSHDQAHVSSVSIYFKLAAGMVIFGSGAPISKIVTNGFPVFVAALLRVGLAALVLLPFLWTHRHDLKRYERTDWLLVLSIALLGTVAFTTLLLYGMQHVSGVAGSIVMSMLPAVTALGAYLFFHEHLGWRKLTAVGLAIVGVVILNLGDQGSGQSSGNIWIGIVMVFGAVCCEAAFTLLGKKASDHVQPLMIVALTSLLSTAIFTPFAVWQFDQLSLAEIAWSDWLALAWWGLATLALGSVLWYRGVAEVPGSVAAGFMGVMPVSALILSYLLLGEAFAWIHLLGFGLVLIGVMLISRAHAQHETT